MSDGQGNGRGGHRWRLVLLAVVLLVVGGALGAGAYHALRNSPTSSPPTSVAQASAGYGLATPASASVAGDDVFVGNQSGNSVTVVDATTGVHVATLTSPSFDFDRPTALATLGPDVFVANGGGNSVTEISAGTRSVVRVLSGPAYQFSSPIAVATDASSAGVFVLSADGTVTGVSGSTGNLLGVAPGDTLGLQAPAALAVAGGRMYVTDRVGDQVAVLDERTFTPVRTLAGAAYSFHAPTGVVADASDLWVTNSTADSVTEISLSTGQPVRVIVDHTNLPTPGPITAGDGYVFTLSPPGNSPMVSQIEPSTGKVAWMMCNTNGPYLFSNPQAVVVSGSNLWVVNKDSNSLTQMNSDSGALIRTIS